MSGAVRHSVELVAAEWLADCINANLPARDDAERMRLAIRLSAAAAQQGAGGPFGAAIFDDDNGELIAGGCNLVFASGASLAHAEMVTLSFAQQQLGRPDLSEKRWTLFSSSEPCAMCTAALPWSGIRRLVYGALNEDVQQIGFDEGSKPAAWVEALQSRGITVETSLLRDEAAAVLAHYADNHGQIY